MLQKIRNPPAEGDPSGRFFSDHGRIVPLFENFLPRVRRYQKKENRRSIEPEKMDCDGSITGFPQNNFSSFSADFQQLFRVWGLLVCTRRCQGKIVFPGCPFLFQGKWMYKIPSVYPGISTLRSLPTRDPGILVKIFRVGDRIQSVIIRIICKQISSIAVN